MCGITGFLTVKNGTTDFKAIIRKMTDSIVHRGPDDAGTVLLSFSGDTHKDCVALGHRRLKIIDLSEKAHQPMLDEARAVAITYNGEIYNYLELRQELLLKGYSFFSNSDTEVVLKAYLEWGTGCFEKFNGMWALAIFDKKRRKIILSRDRFGKKPLYYYKSDRAFVFASEIKAVLKYPHVPKEPNYEKIYRYIANNYRYVDVDNKSYFRDIMQVPKSSFMEIDDSLKASIHYYWQLDAGMVPSNPDEKKTVARYRDLFTDAVSLRLRSDVPVGCMLSGGLDSTAITCVAYKVLKRPITAFSGITGDVKGVYDESDYINAVIDDTHADFHYIRPEPADLFHTINEMLRFHDEPVCTVTWHSLYLIAKKVKLESTPVLLNGHGGDELLAGYWDHYHYYFYDLAQRNDTAMLDEELAAWRTNHGRDPAEIEGYKKYIRGIADGKASEMSRFPDHSDCFIPGFSDKFRKEITWQNPYKSLLKKRLYSEAFFETIPASLRPEDRNTMSQSIESRSPFLDYRLAEFCFSLHDNFKIRQGLGKWIAREAMRGILPEKVRLRKDKAGFIAPADEWFRTVNKLQLYDLINSQSFSSRGIFNVSRINELFQEHIQNQKNHQMLFWQIINLELWLRIFFDK